MTGTAAKIVYDFYWASSDLAANLKFLGACPGHKNMTQQSVTDPEKSLPLTVPSLRQQFEKYVTPFLALTGADLPQEQHLAFSETEDALRETVLPALDILRETWEDYVAAPAETLRRLRDDCDYVRCELEMNIVARASGMSKDMNPDLVI